MDSSTLNPSSWYYSLFTTNLVTLPQNYVHWTQTPDSHIYSADLPGVKKQDIRVEIEDSMYLIIRTHESSIMSFMRKFRVPNMVDLNGVSASYEDGVLTVTLPRSFVRRGFIIEPNDQSETLKVLARAA